LFCLRLMDKAGIGKGQVVPVMKGQPGGSFFGRFQDQGYGRHLMEMDGAVCFS